MLGKLRRQGRATAAGIGALVGIAVLAVAASPAAAAPAGPGPGNSFNAKSCQKGGWMTLVREDSTVFADNGACTSHAARGGTLFHANEAPCLQGGYTDYVTSAGQSFSDQAGCVSYVRGGGQLKPRPTELTPRERCESALADAGLTAPADANYILGTDAETEFFLPTAANDVICGFGGLDAVLFPVRGGDEDGPFVVRAGDIFLGGGGNDYVDLLKGGTFVGGDGDDRVLVLRGGTFNGGSGHDEVSRLEGGTFNGEAGCDLVHFPQGGTFNSGDQSTCPAA